MASREVNNQIHPDQLRWPVSFILWLCVWLSPAILGRPAVSLAFYNPYGLYNRSLAGPSRLGSYPALGWYGWGQFLGSDVSGPVRLYPFHPGYFFGLPGSFALSGFGFPGLGGSGFFGLSSLYGTGNPATLSLLNILAGLGGGSLPLLPRTAISPFASPVIAAEQAGSWEGQWSSSVKNQSGSMTLDLVESPASGGLSGTCIMLLNKLIPVPVDVSGALGPEAVEFILTGTFVNLVNSTEYTLTLTFTLLSPESISGKYIVHDVLYTKADIGEFTLSLIVPVIAEPVEAPATIVQTPIISVPLLPAVILPGLGVLPTGFGLTGLSPLLLAPPLI
ncbi:MAG: hypothetical protein ACMUIA_09255 [bacterium]